MNDVTYIKIKVLDFYYQVTYNVIKYDYICTVLNNITYYYYDNIDKKIYICNWSKSKIPIIEEIDSIKMKNDFINISRKEKLLKLYQKQNGKV
jgi:hypothetical protein